MRFRYYHDNSMFRINVPNEVDGVEWARAHRQGIAVIEKLEDDDIPIFLKLIRPGEQANEIIQRSFLLGTWKKTATRAYGWYKKQTFCFATNKELSKD